MWRGVIGRLGETTVCILSRGGDGMGGMLAGPKVLLLSCYCEPGLGRDSNVHTAHAFHSIILLFFFIRSFD